MPVLGAVAGCWVCAWWRQGAGGAVTRHAVLRRFVQCKKGSCVCFGAAANAGCSPELLGLKLLIQAGTREGHCTKVPGRKFETPQHRNKPKLTSIDVAMAQNAVATKTKKYNKLYYPWRLPKSPLRGPCRPVLPAPPIQLFVHITTTLSTPIFMAPTASSYLIE